MTGRRVGWGERALLGFILCASTALGTHFAIHTPLWQAPDEPAHFNYVAQLADGVPGHPRIAPGDYPAERLERLKAEGFPAGADIAGIEYEDHQPPAYYYAASLPYRFGGPDIAGRARLIRISGAILGLVTIALAWAIARAAWPHEDRAIALATAAGVAFLPMHAAIVAAINNDVLADIAMAAVLLVAVRRVNGGLANGRFIVFGGAALGLALLTKLTVYPAATILVLAEISGGARGGRALTIGALRPVIGALLLGAAVAAPWFIRNAMVYGATDPFGLRAHDLVVIGQPTTAEWIAEHGVAALLRRASVFTFESFWGVFGWMGLFLDQRIYAVLAVFTAGAALGFAGYAGGAIRRGRRGRRVLAVLAWTIAASVLGFVWYNLRFVQHQGRYLFPALIPFTAFGALGVRWIVETTMRRLGASERARTIAARAALLGVAGGMLALSVLALTRYVIPGL